MAIESQAVAQDSLESQYDAKIDACFAEIRRLREARNADCSNTRKLPGEVLTMVFGIVAKDAKDNESYPKLPRWISCTTHVCRNWRNIALSEPGLWTDLSPWAVSSIGWLQELFVRSKTAPLSLYLDGEPSSHSRHVFEQMLQSPERFRSLTVINNKDYLAGLAKPMPYLESLFLSSRTVIPDNFARGSAPRLHSIELRGVDVPLNASWFSNVRTLALVGEWSPTDQGGPLTVKALLEFLSRLPRLEDFRTTLPANMAASTGASPEDVTRLSLKALCIDYGASVIAFKEILRFMVVDTLQSFVVGSSSRSSPPARRCDATMADALDFYVTNTRAPSYSVRWHTVTDQILLMNNLYGASEDYALHLFPSPHCRTLDNYLPNINITMLRLSSYALQMFPLQECKTIEEVQIDAVNGLHEILHLKPSNAIPVPYPSLRRLHLRNSYFKPKTKTIAQLRRWIGERKRLSGFEKLIVEKCGLTDKDVALLAKTIPVENIETARS